MTEAARLEGVIALVGLDQAKRGLVGLGDQVDKTQTDLDGLGKSSRQASKDVEDLGSRADATGKRMVGVGQTLSRRVTLPLLAVGVAAVKVGADFDAQMSKVAAKSGASGKSLEKMRAQALQLGSDTSFSARQAAEGMEILAAAGMKPREVMAAMPGLLDAAAASGEDLASTADVVANALAQFNLDASDSTRIADVLAKASNETQGSISSMGEALKFAGTGAAQMGLDVEETTALLSKMVKAGIDGGQAGTALRMGLQKLATVPPMRALDKVGEISPKLEAIWKSAAPVPEKIEQMSAEFEKLDGTSRVAAAGLIFGTEASTGMLQAMKGGPAEIDKWTKSMRESGGEAKRMGDAMRNNLKGDVEQLGGALETAFIGLFDQADGPLRALAQGATGAVNAFSGLPPAVQQTAVAVGALGVATGPALIGLGMMAQGVGPLTTGFSTAAAGVRLLGSGVGTLAMAVGTAIPALASLSLVIAANPLLTGAVVVGGIVAAGVALATMGDDAKQVGVSAQAAANAVRDLDTAAKALAGTNLSAREAELGLKAARVESASAAIAAAAAVRDYGAGSTQAKGAALALEQAELRVERASLSSSDASKEHAKTLRDMATAARTNQQVLSEEIPKQARLRAAIDATRASMVKGGDAAVTGGSKIAKLGKELDESTAKSNKAAGALGKASGEFRQLGPAASGSAGKVREVANLLAGLPEDVSINVALMYREVNKPRPGRGTYAPAVPGYSRGTIVDGPGTGTSDSIIARVSDGEAIVPADSTSANRGLLEWMIDNPGERVGLPGFAKGRKPVKKAPVTKATATRAMNTIATNASLTNAQNDAALAKAESTARLSDDIARWTKNQASANAQVRQWVAYIASPQYRKLDKNGKASAQSQLAAARRDAKRASDELARLKAPAEAAPTGDAGGGVDSGSGGVASDPAADAARAAEDAAQQAREADLAAQLDQQTRRATAMEANFRLGQREIGALTGPGDMGYAGGANAWQSANGAQPVNVIVQSLTGYSPEIQNTVAYAAGGGFAAGGNSYRMYTGRG